MGPYKNFAQCLRMNSEKNNPEAYCGKIKHQIEGGGGKKKKGKKKK